MVFIELRIPASEDQIVLMVLVVFIVLGRVDLQGGTASEVGHGERNAAQAILVSGENFTTTMPGSHSTHQ
ncbi:hypothetical protein [Pseudomonas sp. OHS18]|uniref:hypothetical protein n=1 Tax=Pseudomonas sp. OHS18 TaxID=3399679 RepID=UPI003A86020C